MTVGGVIEKEMLHNREVMVLKLQMYSRTWGSVFFLKYSEEATCWDWNFLDFSRDVLLPLPCPKLFVKLWTTWLTGFSDSSCASYVGCHGGGQPVYFAASCSVGNLCHELMHALGMYHEHTRFDRDQYISVLWQSIKPGKHWLNCTLIDSTYWSPMFSNKTWSAFLGISPTLNPEFSCCLPNKTRKTTLI